MKILLFILGILIVFSNESVASLSDFLYLERGTQTIGTVTSIIDGDTIEVGLLGTQTRVRLLGIDTPELPDEPFAQQSANFTLQELSGQPIKLFYSNNPTQQKDKYNRLLAVVVKDNEIFNIKLLEQGLAVRMFMQNDIIRFPVWEDVEIKAREQRLNIWSNINSKKIFINEINPNPYPEPDDEAEFVELYNNSSTPVDVGSWTLICIYNEVVIPAGTTIPANGYLIIARVNPTKFRQIYTNTPQEVIIIDGGTNLVLQNSYAPKENLVIHLKAQDKSYQDSITYNLDWDSGGANGSGKTLERKSIFITNVGDSEVGGVDDANWDASTNVKGTPGNSNSLQISPLSYIVITPAFATITIGSSKTFTTIGYDKYGNEQFIQGGKWEIEEWMGNITPITGTQTQFTAGTKAGNGNIRYQLNQIQATATITILPATHTYFKIATISTQTAGVGFTITITACDYYGNTIENYTGKAKLADSTGTIYPSTTTNFTSGVWIGTVTIEKASPNITITVQDTGTPTIKGTSEIFNISHNIFYRFNISGIKPIHIVNSEIPIVITAEDVYGNIITNYNGTFSLTDDTKTIYPKKGTFTSGKFVGTISISKAKPHIKITVTSLDRTEESILFTTLIDSKSACEITGDVGDEKTSIKIPTGVLATDFYVVIDPNPSAQNTNINLANSSLSKDPTLRGITNSLHLFQAYDKDDNEIQVKTDSFISISLPFEDNDQDGFVDYPEAKIKEDTLKIYELKNNRWVEVKNCIVHPLANIVSASVPRFGIYMLIGQIIPTNLNILKVYPNPFKSIRGDSQIIFDGLPSNTTIRIYDISGSLIRQIENITTGTYNWDVRDKYGKDVASGIYIYIVSYDEDVKKIGKIGIIR